MSSECMDNEESPKVLGDEVRAALRARERVAFDRLLARLAAAERVCRLTRTNFTPGFTPKRRGADRAGRAQWWDIGIALREWERLAKP